MKTYLVRTIADQTLMGVFCASSPSALASVIDEVFDARECEYLALGANEGLFVEAKFATVPADTEDGAEVILTHVDDDFGEGSVEYPEMVEDEESLLLAAVADEWIPPVLEPTSALHDRLQAAERQNKWLPLREGASQDPEAPSASARIDTESLARKLLQGPLNPASFMRMPSTRIH